MLYEITYDKRQKMLRKAELIMIQQRALSLRKQVSDLTRLIPSITVILEGSLQQQGSRPQRQASVCYQQQLSPLQQAHLAL